MGTLSLCKIQSDLSSVIFNKFHQNPTYSNRDISRKSETETYTYRQIKFGGAIVSQTVTIKSTMYLYKVFNYKTLIMGEKYNELKLNVDTFEEKKTIHE